MQDNPQPRLHHSRGKQSLLTACMQRMQLQAFLRTAQAQARLNLWVERRSQAQSFASPKTACSCETFKHKQTWRLYTYTVPSVPISVWPFVVAKYSNINKPILNSPPDCWTDRGVSTLGFWCERMIQQLSVVLVLYCRSSGRMTLFNIPRARSLLINEVFRGPAGSPILQYT